MFGKARTGYLMGILGGIVISSAAWATTTVPAEKPFDVWLDKTRKEAVSKGIKQDIVFRALPNTLTPIERVIELDRKQPEGKMTFAEYRKKIVNPQRIKKGRAMMQKHRALLDEVSAAYDVPPQYIVALWGIETNFGSNTGGFDVVPALATLAYDGRREKFFKGELMNALKILDEGHISVEDMRGSWAGAMGQSQFMPSSFLNYAVDYDKDGRRDIWNTEVDVFASAANYLSKHGWAGDELWGRQVRLPLGFSDKLVGLEVKKPLSYWQEKGVRTTSGDDLPQIQDMAASIVQPDGRAGDAFLVYNNYRTIMRWNKSTYFATSVGLLANAIAL